MDMLNIFWLWLSLTLGFFEVEALSRRSPSRNVKCPVTCTCYNVRGNVYYPPPGSPQNKKDDYWSPWMGKAYPRVDCIDAGLSDIPIGNIPIDVKMISLSGNNISALDLKKLENFKRLKILNLKKNGIKDIIPNAGVIFNELTHLILRSNKITNLDKEDFQSFPNLQVLSLFNNLIDNFPSDVFRYNRKLSRIYLGPNPVKTFNEDFVENLSLTSLSLRNLSLREVPEHLGKLINLTFVDLSDNFIQTIKNFTFSNCTKLVRLVLENNKIVNIESNAFNGATSLRSLVLSENYVTSLDGKVFSNMSGEQLNVDLWENPFLCDCKMRKLKEWIDQRNAVDPITDIRFKCHQPLRLHDQYSDQLRADDFTCSNNDVMYIDVHNSNPAGIIAVSIIVTFLTTLIVCIIIFRRMTSAKRYHHQLLYKVQRSYNDEADMEELNY